MPVVSSCDRMIHQSSKSSSPAQAHSIYWFTILHAFHLPPSHFPPSHKPACISRIGPADRTTCGQPRWTMGAFAVLCAPWEVSHDAFPTPNDHPIVFPSLACLSDASPAVVDRHVFKRATTLWVSENTKLPIAHKHNPEISSIAPFYYEMHISSQLLTVQSLCSRVESLHAFHQSVWCISRGYLLA